MEAQRNARMIAAEPHAQKHKPVTGHFVVSV